MRGQASCSSSWWTLRARRPLGFRISTSASTLPTSGLNKQSARSSFVSKMPEASFVRKVSQTALGELKSGQPSFVKLSNCGDQSVELQALEHQRWTWSLEFNVYLPRRAAHLGCTWRSLPVTWALESGRRKSHSTYSGLTATRTGSMTRRSWSVCIAARLSFPVRTGCTSANQRHSKSTDTIQIAHNLSGGAGVMTLGDRYRPLQSPTR